MAKLEAVKKDKIKKLRKILFIRIFHHESVNFWKKIIEKKVAETMRFELMDPVTDRTLSKGVV